MDLIWPDLIKMAVSFQMGYTLQMIIFMVNILMNILIAIWENGDQSESSKFGVPELILSASPNYGGFLVSHKDLFFWDWNFP